MKRLFVYTCILFVYSIQACNSSSAPGTTASDGTTNDSAYDRSTATERVVKPGVKKENINNKSISSENTNNEDTQSENNKQENINDANINNENTKRKNTKNKHAPEYKPIQQDTLNENNSVHINANEVPGAVISALHMRYPTVAKVKWVMSDKKKKTLYIAHWQTHKNKMMAVFAEDGMFIKEKQQ